MIHSSRDRRGQAAVEFALILPLLLILLVGIIEFGRAWNEHQVITDAAREAARRGAIHDDTTTVAWVRQVAMNAMGRAGIGPGRCTTPGSPPAGASCGATCVCVTDGAANEPITVNIDLPYRFTFFGPLVKWTTGESIITLKTSFSMRNE